MENIVSETSQVLLSCNSMSAGYGRASICDDITFQLELGQTIAIVGPNGSGKSTIARTILCRQAPLAGTVRLRGAAVDDRTAAYRSAVSAVFDEDAFFPALTVAEHLELIARGHGMPDVAASVEYELSFFGLEKHARSQPHELSSGQRRRVLLAAAFIRPFELLVLDEPEQRLDAEMRSKLAHRLRRTVAGGAASALVVTHDLELVKGAADYYLVAGARASMVPAKVFQAGQIA